MRPLPPRPHPFSERERCDDRNLGTAGIGREAEQELGRQGAGRVLLRARQRRPQPSTAHGPAPRSRSRAATAGQFSWQATTRRVHLSCLSWLGSTPGLARSSVAMSTWPFWAATWRGVAPASLAWLGSTPEEQHHHARVAFFVQERGGACARRSWPGQDHARGCEEQHDKVRAVVSRGFAEGRAPAVVGLAGVHARGSEEQRSHVRVALLGGDEERRGTSGTGLVGAHAGRGEGQCDRTHVAVEGGGPEGRAAALPAPARVHAGVGQEQRGHAPAVVFGGHVERRACVVTCIVVGLVGSTPAALRSTATEAAWPFHAA